MGEGGLKRLETGSSFLTKVDFEAAKNGGEGGGGDDEPQQGGEEIMPDEGERIEPDEPYYFPTELTIPGTLAAEDQVECEENERRPAHERLHENEYFTIEQQGEAGEVYEIEGEHYYTLNNEALWEASHMELEPEEEEEARQIQEHEVQPSLIDDDVLDLDELLPNIFSFSNSSRCSRLHLIEHQHG